MKRLARITASMVLMIALPLPGFAQTHVIAELGTAPLIGQIASTSALQADVSRQQALFRRAGAKLGLSPREYTQLRDRIASRQVTYVTIPRHLDAMTWSSGGTVYVLHDVVIPAHTNGWEVDLQEQGRQVALFIPARCGNLSVVRRTVPHLAAAPMRRPVVAAAQTSPPPPAPPENQNPGPSVVLPQEAPASPPPPYTTVATSTPAVHHLRLWPLLLLPLIGLISGSHGGGNVNTVSPPGSVNGPGPLPSPGCPQPTPH